VSVLTPCNRIWCLLPLACILVPAAAAAKHVAGAEPLAHTANDAIVDESFDILRFVTVSNHFFCACKKSNYRSGEFLNILGKCSEKLGFGLNFRKRPE
jgi:hypothetical protein